MEAPARQTTRRLITVDNPLPNDAKVTFPDKWWDCDNPNIRVSPVGAMSGNSEGVFEVEYRPLLPNAESGVDAGLSIHCQELGTFKYSLKLKATVPSAEAAINFEAPLGNSNVGTLM